jgi:hypothetical protein
MGTVAVFTVNQIASLIRLDNLSRRWLGGVQTISGKTPSRFWLRLKQRKLVKITGSNGVAGLSYRVQITKQGSSVVAKLANGIRAITNDGNVVSSAPWPGE